VQCLLIFLVLFCVFTGVGCLGLYGTKRALLVSIVVKPSSHNIFTSLCCSVDHLIPTVVILRYDYKFVLNTIVRKLYVVSTCKP